MPIVPEKLSSRHGSRSAIASQFWESSEHSARYIDGQAWELPCEPPALNLTGSSGLSRSQQLIAARSIGIPFVPSYDSNSGGLVLDRVFTKFGGQRWWTAISGRVKAQRMYTSATAGGLKVKALQDLESYALCARTRLQLTRRLSLNAVVETPSILVLQNALTSKTDPATTTTITPSTSPSLEENLATHATLRAILPGHDVTVAVGRNMDYIESSGDYARVPLAVSLDVTSHDRSDGLQYRAGLHQITAPPTENAHTGAFGSTQALRTVLHAQGAVAVEGEAYIWKANGNTGGGTVPNTTPATTNTSTSNKEKEYSAHQQKPSALAIDDSPLQRPTLNSNADTSTSSMLDEDEEGADEGSTTRLSKALATAIAADSGDAIQKTGAIPTQHTSSMPAHSSTDRVYDDDSYTTTTNNNNECDDGSSDEGIGNPNPKNNTKENDTAYIHDGNEHGPISKPDGTTTNVTVSSSSSLESFLSPLTERIGGALHAVTHPGDAAETSEQQQSLQQQQQVPRLLPVTSETVSAAIQDSLTLLHQLKDTVGRVTSDVQDGSLQRLSEQLSRKQAPRRRPYSMLLAQPHVKLNAAMGCLARMPLPPLKAFTLGRMGDMLPPPPHAPSSSSLYHYHQQQQQQQSGAQHGIASFHRRNASASSLTSRASISSQLVDAWEPYLKGTALRIFASTGISGQIGRFTRPFLDYTAASLRLDVGLTSPHVVGSLPNASVSPLNEASRPDKHRAFALEGRGSWHALSASVSQQIIGPLRARADFRFALDPTNIPQNQGERSTLKGLAQTALSVRPSMLEAVYGADVVLPGTEGTARLALWWSPKRREAMAELRLF